MTQKELNNLRKKINILKSVEILLTNENISIKEIAEKEKLGSSTIQRYLNDPFILEILGERIAIEVEERLEKNLLNGRKKGAQNYVDRNEAIKSENGKFCGSFPKNR